MNENDVKNILGLKLPTDPRWVNLAEMSMEEILTDHAFCEQKAATTCISLIQKYSDRVRLVEELSPIVTEEWGHFRQVLAELNKRGLKLGKQRKDEYVNRLLEFERKGGHPEERFLDKLLISALIEARSCELGYRACRASRHDKRQRPRPERLGQPAGHIRHDGDLRNGCGIGEVRDQGIEVRAALRLENSRDGNAIGRVGAESIDRLGWKCDEPSVAQRSGSTGNRLGGRLDELRAV